MLLIFIILAGIPAAIASLGILCVAPIISKTLIIVFFVSFNNYTFQNKVSPISGSE